MTGSAPTEGAPPPPPRALVALSVLSGAVALAAGIAGGLLRSGWALPVAPGAPIAHHGGLMVCGFLGTLIGVERSVALGLRWPWLAPLLSGIGGLMILGDLGGDWALRLILAGSVVLLAVTLAILLRQVALFTAVPVLGAVCLVAGNAHWTAGRAIPELVHAWMAFLLLTITGERLELGRLRRPPTSASRALGLLSALYVGAVLAIPWMPGPAVALAGALQIGLALWLWRYDVARVTVRTSGLARYVAVCLLLGFLWLAASGALLVAIGPVEYGLGYDATLHAFFLGFVFSMIFGHAPIIFPAIFRVPITYHPAFYVPFLVMHASLLARLGGDLVGSASWRSWGAAGNAAAILGFPAVLVVTGLREARRQASEG